MTDQEVVTDYREYRDDFYLFPTSLFKFRVKATDHVVISCTATPKFMQPVYEIVLGTHQNTDSYISFNNNEKYIQAITPQILDPNNYRSFWINWQQGSISVGKENEATPFLSWANPTFTAKYFGLATHGPLCFWIIESFPKPFEVYSSDTDAFQTYYPLSGSLMRNNTESFIIKTSRSKVEYIVTAKTPGILDPKNFVASGSVGIENYMCVGRETEVKPFLCWTSHDIVITYFTYSTTRGSNGTWIFEDSKEGAGKLSDIKLPPISKLNAIPKVFESIVTDYLTAI
ncbi:hypothetical protein JTB14_005350 [Gonioctena quinquepunctata]|nr:hypothetical protein JTB14_005350 [Gonioctena quinquepunctata]